MTIAAASAAARPTRPDSFLTALSPTRCLHGSRIVVARFVDSSLVLHLHVTGDQSIFVMARCDFCARQKAEPNLPFRT